MRANPTWSGQLCWGPSSAGSPMPMGPAILRGVTVPITVRSVVGRAGAPGLRPEVRLVALTRGLGRMFVRRRTQLGWLTLVTVWLLR
jgi:hypothetical protein